MAAPSQPSVARLVHKSALCLIPPRAVWPRIQEIRCFNDKSFVRWPPHINLLYPFLEDRRTPDGDPFAAAAERAAQAVQGLQPFEVSLSRLAFFEHGSNSATVWVDPASPELLELQAVLQAAFPQCTHLSNDPSRGITAFTPHLSLGQWRGRAAATAAAEALAASWPPLSWHASSVALISRHGYEDPFCIRWVVPLGGCHPPAEVNLPYIATVGSAPGADSRFAPTCTSSGSSSGSGSSSSDRSDRQHPASWLASPLLAALPPLPAGPAEAERVSVTLPASPPGASPVGAAVTTGALNSGAPATPLELGVWNFAYGANMSPAKLGGARGLHPQRSLPARLPGWRLCFTHRGAMGNLVQAPASHVDAKGPHGESGEEAATASARRPTRHDVAVGAAEGSMDGATGSAGPAPAAAEQAQAGVQAVHGVLHLLRPEEFARLACMEHEYRPVEVEVVPYDARTAGPAGTIRAVAFVTPAHRCTADGLPPSERYLSLIREGAAHWGLDGAYQSWLGGLASVAGSDRGPDYYTAVNGSPLDALPKIRTGGQRTQGRQRRRGGGQAGRRAG